MQKKIGIVIINYNDYATTQRLIKNIEQYKCLAQIVVVDNNSTDDSYKMLKRLENNKIAVLKNKSRNFSSGLNLGAKYLIKKLGYCNIAFSNSDIIIKSEKDLEMLSSNIKNDIVVVGPTVEEHGNLNRGWRLPTANLEILMNLPLINKYIRRKKLLYGKDYYAGDTTYVDVVSGCFFIVDSKFLESIKFFDPNTFLYYEEQIFAVKVKQIGKKEIIDNKVNIIHDHSVSIDKSIKRIQKHKILKTSQRYYAKNYLGANFIQMALLYITDKLYVIILYIRCLIGR